MLTDHQLFALERRLEEAREEIKQSRDMSRRASHDFVRQVDDLLDKLSKVYERQPDEDYMDNYNEGLHKRQPDEDYMEQFDNDEDQSEMMSEFGEPGQMDMEAAGTDEPRYDRGEPHEHMGPNEERYHIDDDTGENEELQDRFGGLCKECRRERRSRRRR